MSPQQRKRLQKLRRAQQREAGRRGMQQAAPQLPHDQYGAAEPAGSSTVKTAIVRVVKSLARFFLDY